MDNVRLYKFDNIKFLLIFFVVFAHLLELFDTNGAIYRWIYSFHMPFFIFIFGFFSKFKIKNLLNKFILPYMIFQVLYILFENYILHNNLTMQFYQPYWLLWYLFSSAIYLLILPIINVKNKYLKITILLISVIISLLIGYLDDVGYRYSLSRTFVFLPFFILGVYFKNSYRVLENKFNSTTRKTKIIIKLLFLILLIISSILAIKYNTNRLALYGSYSYNNANYTILDRSRMLLLALAIIFSVIVLIPNKECSFISKYNNSYSIYLLHGFFIKLFAYYDIFHFPIYFNYALSIIITIIVIMLLGNRFVAKIFK